MQAVGFNSLHKQVEIPYCSKTSAPLFSGNRARKKGPSGHLGQVDIPAGKALGQCLKDTEKLTN